MLLKNISLKNIRSYKALDLEFSEGTTLLSGDIGSGKTTILLAIEFALFGIIKGTLTGGMLLRHGSQKGEVSLTFEIEKKQVTIQRTLKRSSTGITQDAGYLEINGIREDATAVELKSKILDLLGYPEDLLTKSKSMVFRYTVYTPQEELKQILYESSEERVEKLRRIFDIDKYKRIKENSANYAKELRARKRILQEETKQLSAIEEKQKLLKTDLETKEMSLKETTNELEKNQEKEKELLEGIKLFEDEVKKLSELKSNMRLTQAKIESSKRTISQLERQKAMLVEEAGKKIEFPAQKIDTTALTKEISALKDTEKETREKLSKAEKNIAVLESRILQSKEIAGKINTLDNCPTCGQKVTDDHKHKVSAEENTKLNILQKKLDETKTYEEKHKTGLQETLKKIDETNTLLRTAEINNLKIAEVESKIKDIEKKKLQAEKTTAEISAETNTLLKLSQELKNLEAEAKNITIDEKQVDSLKKDYSEAQLATRRTAVKQAEIKASINATKTSIEETTKTITALEDKIKELEKITTTENWISEAFINTVDVIEKHVLGSIHIEFSTRFQEWFNLLLEDETITSTLDDSFTPVLIQNGYETTIDNLSGGEKSSVALAYRLALNKVINDFLSNIKTRDIIILDEPTDGFSTDQLDKLRDVLEELSSKQTIIVSHEQKLESFVNNIIKIRKQEHESALM